MTDGFLSRWSRRKLDVQEGKPVLAEPPAPVAAHAPAAVPSTPVPVPAAEGGGGNEGAPEAPLPSLADAQALTPQSDFKPFMARGVAADVKNAAMKKLFADPHYNVMDRLDTYIDDYSLPDPIPEAMLRQMVSAKFLNLFDDDDKPEDKQDAASPAASPPPSPRARPEPLREDANTPTSEVVAQSQFTLQPPIDHDHTDMRLQPDHAPEGKNPGRGAA